MRRLPVVISPIRPLLQREGADIALISVELWRSETIVRLAALVPDPVAEEAVHDEVLERWAAAGRVAPVPLMPGETRFAGVAVALSDDIGTTYQLRSSAVGGTGRMFRGDWHFTTGVPDAARVLTVTGTDQLSGEESQIELRL